MVNQNHFVIPATVLEKFRSRGFPKGVTLTADHCNMTCLTLSGVKTRRAPSERRATTHVATNLHCSVDEVNPKNNRLFQRESLTL